MIHRDTARTQPDLKRKIFALLKDVNSSEQLPDGWELDIFETWREDARQVLLYRTGMSKTLNSKHKIQKDGYSHAVDVVWKHNGTWTWNGPKLKNGKDGWTLVDKSAIAHNLKRISWDKPHCEYEGDL